MAEPVRGPWLDPPDVGDLRPTLEFYRSLARHPSNIATMGECQVCGAMLRSDEGDWCPRCERDERGREF